LHFIHWTFIFANFRNRST